MADTKTLQALAVGVGAGILIQRLLLSSKPSKRRGVVVGDTMPSIKLDDGAPGKTVNIKDFCAGKKVVITGVPGPWTPT